MDSSGTSTYSRDGSANGYRRWAEPGLGVDAIDRDEMLVGVVRQLRIVDNKPALASTMQSASR